MNVWSRYHLSKAIRFLNGAAIVTVMLVTTLCRFLGYFDVGDIPCWRLFQPRIGQFESTITRIRHQRRKCLQNLSPTSILPLKNSLNIFSTLRKPFELISNSFKILKDFCHVIKVIFSMQWNALFYVSLWRKLYFCLRLNVV